MSLYQLHNVSHDYDGRTVLDIDDWQVPADSVTGVVGPNGSGKSTLLSLLGFAATPTRGEILFNGRPAEPFDESVRGQVVMLPQDSFLLKRSVYGNVAYGLRIRKTSGNIDIQVHQALEMVGLASDGFARRPWFALSGGEIRRVALAARLALQPKVLLMDEPTTSVDAASAQLMKEAALHARQQWGTTLLVTSHDVQWLTDTCDQIVPLFRGRIMGKGQHSMIFGPWKAQGSIVHRSIAVDQDFQAAPIPDNLDSAVAALPAEHAHLFLDTAQIPASHHRLQGLLLRLNFEKNTRRVNAAVAIGGTILAAYLPEDEDAACRYSPGQKVWVGYDPMRIEWF